MTDQEKAKVLEELNKRYCDRLEAEAREQESTELYGDDLLDEEA